MHEERCPRTLASRVHKLRDYVGAGNGDKRAFRRCRVTQDGQPGGQGGSEGARRGLRVLDSSLV